MFLCSKDAEFFADSNDYNNLLLLEQNMAVGEQILKLLLFISANLDFLEKNILQNIKFGRFFGSFHNFNGYH